jgi:hypothetical protein
MLWPSAGFEAVNLGNGPGSVKGMGRHWCRADRSGHREFIPELEDRHGERVRPVFREEQPGVRHLDDTLRAGKKKSSRPHTISVGACNVLSAA